MVNRKRDISVSKNTEAVIESSIALFKEKEYSDITVRDICKKAEVSTSSFYSIFSGKDDVVLYMLRQMKDDSASVIDGLIYAKNDLERIWRLYDRFINFALEFGREFFCNLMFMNTKKQLGIMDQFFQYSDWFAVLVKNCQQIGIIRNKEPAENLVLSASYAAFGIAYEWSRKGSIDDLREACFTAHEAIYNISEEYRGLWRTI